MPDVSTQTDKQKRRPFKIPTIKKAVKKRPPKNQEPPEKPILYIMFDDVE